MNRYFNRTNISSSHDNVEVWETMSWFERLWKVKTVESGSVFWLLRHWFCGARGGGCTEETLGSTALLSFKSPDISFALVCISLSLSRMCFLFFDDLESDQRGKHYIVKLADANSRLIGKDPDAGKDWGKEEKGMTEDERLNGITDSMNMSLSKLREIVKDREGVCCSLWGRKEWPTGGSERDLTLGDFLCTDFPF